MANANKVSVVGKQAASALLAMILIGGTAWADYKAYGLGAESCGSWTEIRDAQAGRGTTQQWVAGYLTAYSMWVEDGSGPVTRGDIAGPLAWINNYCQENPLKPVAEAAERLIFAIRDK